MGMTIKERKIFDALLSNRTLDITFSAEQRNIIENAMSDLWDEAVFTALKRVFQVSKEMDTMDSVEIHTDKREFYRLLEELKYKKQ